jgi:hypothetical protein
LAPFLWELLKFPVPGRGLDMRYQIPSDSCMPWKRKYSGKFRVESFSRLKLDHNFFLPIQFPLDIPYFQRVSGNGYIPNRVSIWRDFRYSMTSGNSFALANPRLPAILSP